MYRKILVPLDGTELAECVLPHVEGVVSGYQAQNIVLARVVEPYHPIWVVRAPGCVPGI
jgi:nucleotide-binding universal stress UspA family protein